MAVFVVMLLSLGCSISPYEELRVDQEMELIILPFKKNDKYIAFEIERSENEKEYIRQVKSIKNIHDLVDWETDRYMLIDRIEYFDDIYREGRFYFIKVRTFLEENGRVRYVYINEEEDPLM